MAAPPVTTTADNTMVVSLYGTKVGTAFTPPASTTERWDLAPSGGNSSTRTTSMAADAVQPAAGASAARVATAGTSVTGVAHTVALRPLETTGVIRYGYEAPGDSPDVTLDATGAVTERFHSLVGGASMTKRASSDV